MTVRSATLRDALEMAPLLRKEDLDEVQALGLSAEQALRAGLQDTRVCMSIVSGGSPIAMFGSHRVNEGGVLNDVIWLLGTPEILDIRRLFLRESRRWLAQLTEGCDLMSNSIDARNVEHIRWLHWLGFKFLSVTLRGPQGLPFIDFARLPLNV